MSDYSRQEDFSVKDALTTGDPDKVIKGSEVDSEFDALVTAVATKIDVLSGHTTNDIVYLNSVGKLVDAGILYTDIARLTTTQTITGDKTFSGAATFSGATIVPTPSADTHAATKVYVDGLGIEAGTALTLDPYAVSTASNQAHGLGASPTFLKSYLECKSTDLGWAAGDRVDYNAQSPNNSFSIGYDATSIFSTTSTNAPAIHNKTTGAVGVITASKWKLVVTAFLVGG